LHARRKYNNHTGGPQNGKKEDLGSHAIYTRACREAAARSSARSARFRGVPVGEEGVQETEEAKVDVGGRASGAPHPVHLFGTAKEGSRVVGE